MKNHIVLLLAAGASLALSGCGSDAESDANQATANLPEAPADSSQAQAPAGTEPVAQARLAVATKEAFGDYLVDGQGRSLYVLEGTRAEGESGAATLRCTDACLGEWPPLLTSGAPAAAQGLDQAKLGTISRDGAMQVTYAGWPLFYYVGDRDPGSTSGQDLHDQWGEWYLLSPEGEMVHTESGSGE